MEVNECLDKIIKDLDLNEGEAFMFLFLTFFLLTPQEEFDRIIRNIEKDLRKGETRCPRSITKDLTRI